MDVLEIHVPTYEVDSGGARTVVVEIGQSGPPGPPGVDGGSYTHTQATPASVWTITHPLGYRPNVALADADGYSMDALISWPTTSSVVCAFGAQVSGKAYLS